MNRGSFLKSLVVALFAPKIIADIKPAEDAPPKWVKQFHTVTSQPYCCDVIYFDKYGRINNAKH